MLLKTSVPQAGFRTTTPKLQTFETNYPARTVHIA
jgi:hypothetical protein